MHESRQKRGTYIVSFYHLDASGHDYSNVVCKNIWRLIQCSLHKTWYCRQPVS